MTNPFKRSKSDYTLKYERERLLNWLNDADPETDDYAKVTARLKEIDDMLKHVGEIWTVAIPAAATVISVGGIYALQQFAGIIVPKVVDAIAARKETKSATNK